MKYSISSLVSQALSGHKGWPKAWRSPKPRSKYDVIIIGGGGHGLATAYYLAKNHGISRIAVIDKSWIGSGNVGRNTTIVRSNYGQPANTRFYDHSVKLWENLSQELNYNVMFSQRGVMNLILSDSHWDEVVRRGNTMLTMGGDAEILSRQQVLEMVPMLHGDHPRYPVLGALMQRRGGTARHDAVAWGYARAADQLGVDLIQNCEVTSIDVKDGRAIAVETSQGRISADKIGIAVAGHTSQVAQMAGLELPVESHILQAFVTEGVKPVLDHVVSFTAGGLFYISQSDKGGLVFGGNIDGYNSFASRGNMHRVRHVMSLGQMLMPSLGRLRVLRSWGGVMDMSMDGSPFITKTPVDSLYLNGGWCYGGFKATPASGWCFAHTIAHNEPHELNRAFSYDRFKEGRVIDETGSGPSPWLH